MLLKSALFVVLGLAILVAGLVAYAATQVAHLFFNVDKMVGGDFEAGLADLKSVVEGAPAPRS